MKSSFIFMLLVLVVCGCKKIDNNVPVIKNAKLLLQDVPDTFSIAGLTLACTSSLDLSGVGYVYGFCYSFNQNPSIPGSNVVSKNYAAGSFSAAFDNVEFGKKYYVRAFITNGFATNYSNQDSFFTPPFFYTGAAKNISALSFDISLYTNPAIAAGISERGVCYDTFPNPTINRFTFISPVSDTGLISFHVSGTLKAARAYYAKSYFVAGNKTFYGNEINFRTAGYKAASGGYIIFDKADTTNGWRFIEAAADTIKAVNAIWGCRGSTIGSTLTALGSGLENSNAIVAGCTDTTTAAYRCRNLMLNSKKDWYLPSIDELKLLYELKLASVLKRTDTLFSSTEATANECHIIYLTDGVQRQLPKNSTAAKAWAFRRSL